MKVLHLISAFTAGGAETLVFDLAKELKNLKTEQFVCALSDISILGLIDSKSSEFQKDTISSLKNLGIGARILDIKNRKDIFKGMRRVAQLINQEKPDIIHTHLDFATLYLRFLSKTKSIPVIFTHHTTPVRAPFFQKYLFKNYIQKYIAISPEGKDKLIQDADIQTDKIELIPHGIPMTKTERKKHNKEKNHLTIISVGRLSKEKNHKLQIMALKAVKEECLKSDLPIPKLNIVGVGNEEESLNELISKHDLADQVTLMGLLKSRNDIYGALGESDVFLVSSLFEGISIAILEAMATGLPIIATDVGGNPQLVKPQHNGFLVPSNDVTAMKAAIIKLMKDKDLRSDMGRNSALISENFNIVNTAQKHVELYNTLI